MALNDRGGRGARTRPQRRRAASLGAEGLGIDQLQEPLSVNARTVPSHRQLSHVDHVELLRLRQPVDDPRDAVRRMEVERWERWDAAGQACLNRSNERRDCPLARDEMYGVRNDLELTQVLVASSDWRRRDERTAMVPETAQDLVSDQRVPLHQAHWRRPVDHENVQTHATTASMLSAIHRR
jgi:hypothetical protein